jgi:hypothetical protein
MRGGHFNELLDFSLCSFIRTHSRDLQNIFPVDFVVLAALGDARTIKDLIASIYALINIKHSRIPHLHG